MPIVRRRVAYTADLLLDCFHFSDCQLITHRMMYTSHFSGLLVLNRLDVPLRDSSVVYVGLHIFPVSTFRGESFHNERYSPDSCCSSLEDGRRPLPTSERSLRSFQTVAKGEPSEPNSIGLANLTFCSGHGALEKNLALYRATHLEYKHSIRLAAVLHLMTIELRIHKSL